MRSTLHEQPVLSVLSLPYTVLIMLVELAVGSLAIAVVFDSRGVVTRGYVKMAALVVVPLVVLALLTYRGLGTESDLDGYTLRRSWLPMVRWGLIALLAFSTLHLASAFSSRRRATLVFGSAGTLVGALVLAALAAVIAGPAWSYPGMLGNMVAATMVLGGTLMAMTWGHWYLTNSGLPKEPMEQMSLLVIAALLVQALFVFLGVMLPAREAPLSDAVFGGALGQNPAFWLRVGVGLLLPLLAATLAWQAATIRGMMSATGLLYIAVGTTLAGEVLARGLLFTTGAAI